MENFKKDLFMYVASGMIIVAFLFVLIYMNLFIPDNPVTGNYNASFQTVVALIVGYYWGSSKGSNDKNKMLENDLKKG